MKQRKFGSRIQNWHRPLGPNQLSNRYRRSLNDDPILMHRGQQLTANICDEYVFFEAHGFETDIDEAIGYFDDCPLRWFNWDSDSLRRYCSYQQTFDFQVHRVWGVLLARTNPFQVLVGTASTSPAIASVSPFEPMPATTSERPLDQRLAVHVSLFLRMSTTEDWVAANLWTLHTKASAEALKQFANQPLLERVVKVSCLFAPFWLRAVDSFTGCTTRQWLDHLFVRYPVPEFLYSALEAEQDEQPLKWWIWFIVFAQSGSLKRTASRFGWQVPKALAQHLLSAPPQASPLEAIAFAEVRCLGGSERDALRISGHPGYLHDPTEPFHPAKDINRSVFRRETACWLIRHGEQLDDDEAGLVLDWALHRHTEAIRAELPPFSWRGRQLQPTLAASQQYRRSLSRAREGHCWMAHGWDWQFQDEREVCWSFTELLSGEALFDEGQAMRHCVSGYAARCADGYSAIVSVQRGDIRALTIELNPASLRIVQVHGTRNREATTAEWRIINLWLDTLVRSSPDGVRSRDAPD